MPKTYRLVDIKEQAPALAEVSTLRQELTYRLEQHARQGNLFARQDLILTYAEASVIEEILRWTEALVALTRTPGVVVTSEAAVAAQAMLDSPRYRDLFRLSL